MNKARSIHVYMWAHGTLRVIKVKIEVQGQTQ